MKILFWVQHLLGIGHVARAAALTDALIKAGFKVTVAFGGQPVEAVRFRAEMRYLPAIRATDQTFAKLVAVDGRPLARTLAERTARLAEIGGDVAPDVVLIEAWPFGRRPFSDEIEAMLAATDAFTAVSVRDILQTRRKPGRTQETRRRLEEHADLVLVHSDPRMVTLDATFSPARNLAVPVEHTGYVAQPGKVRPGPSHDIVVSVGGGAFGGPLVRAALEAAAMDPERHWCISTGPNLPEFERPPAGDNVEIVPYLSPLADHLAGARVSVSQAGYNTVTDVLRAQAYGTRAVLVPSDTGDQTEQLSRARALAKAGAVVSLPESRLTPKALLAAIAKAPLPPVHDVRLDGAERTAALLKDAVARRLAA